MALGIDQFLRIVQLYFSTKKYYNTLGTTWDPLDRKVSSEMSMICDGYNGLKYTRVFPWDLSVGESQVWLSHKISLSGCYQMSLEMPDGGKPGMAST